MSAHDADELNDGEQHRLVGLRLRQAREVLGLTQEDVAGALAVPRTSVIAMEAGRRKVSGLELRRLARLYRRDVGWLLGEETAPSPAESALYRAAAALTAEDKQQVLRFAEFLASSGTAARGHDQRTRSPVSAPPPTPPQQPGQ